MSELNEILLQSEKKQHFQLSIPEIVLFSKKCQNWRKGKSFQG